MTTIARETSDYTDHPVGLEPVGTAAGARMCAVVSGFYFSTPTFTPPVGWTQVGATQFFGNTGCAFFTLDSPRGSSAPDLTWTVDSSTYVAVTITASSGRASGAPTFATVTGALVNGFAPLSIVASGGTAAAGDDLVILHGFDANNDGTWTWGAPSCSLGTGTDLGTNVFAYAGSNGQSIDGVAGGATGSITSVLNPGYYSGGSATMVVAWPAASSGTNTPKTITATQTQTASLLKGNGFLKALSATIAQSVSRNTRVGLPRSKTQTQTVGAGPTTDVSNPLAIATQVQTATRVRAIGDRKSAVATQTLVRGRSLAQARSATIAQAPSVIKGQGFLKTLTATVAQTLTRLRVVGRPLTKTQAQASTRQLAMARRVNATQAQVLTRAAGVAKAPLTKTQVQTASVVKGQGYLKTLAVTVTQTVSIIRALGLLRSAVQIQTLVRSVALARALSTTQAQAALLTRALARGLAVTEAQSSSLARSSARLMALSATISQTATRSRGVGRLLLATASQTLTRTRALARALSVTDSQSPSAQVVPSGGGPVNVPLALSAAITQTVALARACSRALAMAQVQTAIRARALTLVPKNAAQAQTPSLVKGSGFFKTIAATVSQAGSRVRGFALPRSSTASQTPTQARSIALARTATETQSPAVTKGQGLFKTLAAGITQAPTVAKGRGYLLTLAATITQSGAIRRALGRTLRAIATAFSSLTRDDAVSAPPELVSAPPARCSPLFELDTAGRSSPVFDTAGSGRASPIL